ncbi:MAG: LTA synthase family protein, partial [Agathobacter sp.]|nr:LTA synthase family protein [Agathobacter sp.]
MLGNMEQTVARKQTKREKNNTQKRTEGWKQKGIWLFWYAVVPVFAFYLMECYEHNPFAEVRVGAQLFNIFLFELIGWMLYFLTGRMCFASRVLYGLAVAFGITNHYVMKFRSTPFVPWDLFSAGTAASVAGNYDFTPDRRMVIVTLVFIALFVLTRLFKKGPRFSWKIRLGSIVLVGLVLCTFVNALQQESFQTKHYLYPFLFTPAYMTKVNGMAVTFAMDLAYVAVERPAGYDADE